MSALWLDLSNGEETAPKPFSIVLVHNGHFSEERAQRFVNVLAAEFCELLSFDIASWPLAALHRPGSEQVSIRTAAEADLLLLSFDSAFWRHARADLESWLERIHQSRGNLHNVIGITDDQGVDFSIAIRPEFQALAPHARLVYLPAVLNCSPSAFSRNHHWIDRDNPVLGTTLAGLVEHTEPHRHGGINE